MNRALTICQPYPALILLGEKPVENRTWATRVRGPLLLHAGMSRTWLRDGDEAAFAARGMPLVFGAIVGRCILADCLHIKDIRSGRNDARFPQLVSRAHCHGTYCFVLAEVERLATPIPYKGKQGFFEVPDDVLMGAEWIK